MREKYSRIVSGFEWVWRDYLALYMLAFMALAALVTDNAPTDARGTPPGVLIVTLGWDTARDIDVDLWVEAPGDAPVGYSRRTGLTFDLLHDHRGAHVEGNFNNMEIAAARDIPAGRYTVNAAAFSSWDGVFPVHVWTTVEKVDPATHVATRLFKREGDLVKVNDEITLISFRLDEKGAVVPGSVNDALTCIWKRC